MNWPQMAAAHPKPKIDPCPFCGSEVQDDCQGDGEIFYLFCDTCGCLGPEGYGYLDAIESWNRRKL